MFFFPKDIIKGLVSFIYPPLCEICGIKIANENNNICEKCFNKIITITPPVAIRQNDINIWAVCAYEGTLKECIHLFKYKSRLGLAGPLSRLMINFTNNYLNLNKFDIIMPVPLHRNRLLERGFNQAELLAKNLSKNSGCAICPNLLKKTKSTRPQTGLSKTKRSENIKNAFKVNKKMPVKDKNILIVDDVLTTGSTIAECADTLLEAGANSVQALVLARGI